MIIPHIEKQFPGDHPRIVAIRQYLANACVAFVKRGLADHKFESELASGSTQKFWACISEALIADRLSDKNFGSREMVGVGPDFLVMAGSRKVWIEVVCPEPTHVPAGWLNPEPGVVVNFPHKEI